MKLSELNYAFPEELIATAPQYPPRTLCVAVAEKRWRELAWSEVLDVFKPGDVLVINNSKVIPRRIFSGAFEILFVREQEPRVWEVLFPSKSLHQSAELSLPGGVSATLLKKGRPQLLKVSQELRSDYFISHGEMPLPPYIQKARGERHHKSEDAGWYQTVFAKAEGSLAAPTAGLHFKGQDLDALKKMGVEIVEITLHVGLGTFLPIQTEEISNHEMHNESFEVSAEAWVRIQTAVKEQRRIFALGTTSARVIESLARWAKGSELDRFKIFESERGLRGETKIYLHPPNEFLWTSALMTNFHQPGSTLLAMMGSFAGIDLVHQAYKFAIEKNLDFSVTEIFQYGSSRAF